MTMLPVVQYYPLVTVSNVVLVYSVCMDGVCTAAMVWLEVTLLSANQMFPFCDVTSTLTNQDLAIVRPEARSSSHRCPMFCYGLRVERHFSWKRRVTVWNRVWDTFSLVWWVCQKCQPKKIRIETTRTMGTVKSFNMCLLQLCIRNNWRYLKTCLS